MFIGRQGHGPFVVPCLVDLYRQANERWPGRPRSHDGSIGDRAHSARKSDHNPNWRGAICAIDVGVNRQQGDELVTLLVTQRDPRIKYVIWHGQMWRSYAKPGIPAWSAAPYRGSNPHNYHVHISVRDQNSARPLIGGVSAQSTDGTHQEDELTTEQALMLQYTHDYAKTARIKAADNTERLAALRDEVADLKALLNAVLTRLES